MLLYIVTLIVTLLTITVVYDRRYMRRAYGVYTAFLRSGRGRRTTRLVVRPLLLSVAAALVSSIRVAYGALMRY